MFMPLHDCCDLYPALLCILLKCKDMQGWRTEDSGSCLLVTGRRGRQRGCVVVNGEGDVDCQGVPSCESSATVAAFHDALGVAVAPEFVSGRPALVAMTDKTWNAMTVGIHA